METLALLIRKAIDDGTATISQLADDSGLSRQHIYNILKGHGNVQMEKAEKLASLVGARFKIELTDKKSA